MKISVKFFPSFMMVWQVLAAAVYFINWREPENIRMGVYWVAAAVLTAMVTF